MKDITLTPKQLLFVSEYQKDLNATQAAIRAGYSARTAAEQASRLLTNVKIRAEIAKSVSNKVEEADLSANRVLKELGRLAFFDVRKLFNSDGSPKQIHELDDETAPAISGFEVIELFEGTGDQKHCYGLLKKYKLADKGQNLERLGRYHKLFTDKVEVAEEVSLAQTIADARKRVADATR